MPFRLGVPFIQFVRGDGWHWHKTRGRVVEVRPYNAKKWVAYIGFSKNWSPSFFKLNYGAILACTSPSFLFFLIGTIYVGSIQLLL